MMKYPDNMNKYKRFEIRKGHVEHIIEHNHPTIPMMFASTSEICDRLNELYDENQELKRINRICEDQVTELRRLVHIANNYIMTHESSETKKEWQKELNG